MEDRKASLSFCRVNPVLRDSSEEVDFSDRRAPPAEKETYLLLPNSVLNSKSKYNLDKDSEVTTVITVK